MIMSGAFALAVPTAKMRPDRMTSSEAMNFFTRPTSPDSFFG